MFQLRTVLFTHYFNMHGALLETFKEKQMANRKINTHF